MCHECHECQMSLSTYRESFLSYIIYKIYFIYYIEYNQHHQTPKSLMTLMTHDTHDIQHAKFDVANYRMLANGSRKLRHPILFLKWSKLTTITAFSCPNPNFSPFPLVIPKTFCTFAIKYIPAYFMKTDNLKQYIEDLNQQYKTGSARKIGARKVVGL